MRFGERVCLKTFNGIHIHFKEHCRIDDNAWKWTKLRMINGM